MHSLLKDAAFAGGPANFLIWYTMLLWRMHTIASRAFCDSPRGRWAMHALCEGTFLCLYQLAVFYPEARFASYVLVALLVFVVGNILETVQHVTIKYGSPLQIKQYVREAWWNALNLCTHVTLLALVIMMLLRRFAPPNTAFADGYSQGDRLQLAVCTMAVPVWVSSSLFSGAYQPLMHCSLTYSLTLPVDNVTQMLLRTVG